jgi:tetratricopeptide (TPR) repeat protein
MNVLVTLAALLLHLSALQQGEKLFLENRPREALPLLEQALNENPDNERLYLYLGIVYEQLASPEKSIQVMRRGLAVARGVKDLLYFNLGNNLFRQKEYTVAEQMYSNALELNPAMDDAWLNRANARLQLQSYADARTDYIEYLRLAPATPQRESIEKLIALLGGMLDEAERLKQEELARQKALLNEVLNSLQNASEDTRNLSAGSEDIQEQYDEVDIED